VIDEPTTQFDGGPSACPFVAFEDDRDHRSSSPDYRHRCFAAPEPEPRAFPHQERYCLSADFPACPVFLDWARQEAAGVKAANASASTPAGVALTAGAAAAAAITEDENAPAFLAARSRTAPGVDTTLSSRRAADASATLWTYDSETKRSQAPAAPPPPSSLGAPAVAMARRGPSHPGWENPPRLENFPRLRSREDRRGNQPLLIVVVGMSLVMVALILFPIFNSPKSGGTGGGAGTSAPTLNGGGSGQTDQATDQLTPSPEPSHNYFTTRVIAGDTVMVIANRYQVDYRDILALNPSIKAPAYIVMIGQTIKVPLPGYQPPEATPSAS
jgi:LysM repeat protein